MTAQRPLIEKVLDIVVYAPVGLVLGLQSDLDARVSSGRTRLSERVQVARWIGEMAVTYGRRELERRVSELSGESSAATPSAIEAAVEPHAAAPEPEHVRVASPLLAPPFEGYQSLAAAQVVQLLGRLSLDELADVQAYETANRGRRTILAKLDQLIGRA